MILRRYEYNDISITETVLIVHNVLHILLNTDEEIVVNPRRDFFVYSYSITV